MTIDEAIHKMEYSKRAYQMLIDERVQEGVMVGKGINAEWSADTPLNEAYMDMLDACDMAINSLQSIKDIKEHIRDQLDLNEEPNYGVILHIINKHIKETADYGGADNDK